MDGVSKKLTVHHYLDVPGCAADVDPVERIARMSIDFLIFLEPAVETGEIKDDEVGEIGVVGDIARTCRTTELVKADETSGSLA
ncbi:hypothetical protein [Cryobacterium sp. Y62]|uniref:hypothetical protein n=1 Tax=Cryobacterium sp. Y62 TaxID=2048284 RepID=UPI0018EE2CCC|nr:hypothetical protein [Cryobacterium sp. Y62]